MSVPFGSNQQIRAEIDHLGRVRPTVGGRNYVAKRLPRLVEQERRFRRFANLRPRGPVGIAVTRMADELAESIRQLKLVFDIQ